MTAALGLCAAFLAVAAAVQAVRIAIRQGDWMPLSIGVGLVAAIALMWLLAVLVSPHTR